MERRQCQRLEKTGVGVLNFIFFVLIINFISACKKEATNLPNQLPSQERPEIGGGIQVSSPALPINEPLPNMQSNQERDPEIIGNSNVALDNLLSVVPVVSTQTQTPPPTTVQSLVPPADASPGGLVASANTLNLKLVPHKGVRYAINLILQSTSVVNLCLIDSMFPTPPLSLEFNGYCSDASSTSLDQISAFEIIASRDGWKTRQQLVVPLNCGQKDYVFDFIPFQAFAFDVKGPIKNRSISLHADISSKDFDQNGSIFVLALVPAGNTTIAYALDEQNIFVRISSIDNVPARLTGSLPKTFETKILEKSDVSALVGTKFIMGYGLGENSHYQDMVDANRMMVVHQIAP